MDRCLQRLGIIYKRGRDHIFPLDNKKTGTVQYERSPWLLLSRFLLEGRCIPVLRLPVFDTTSPGLGDRLKPRICASREFHPSEDLSELPVGRVSLCTDEVVAKQLVLLFCGRMSTARRLTWPSFMRGNRTGGSWRILQCRFALVGRFVRERISVAGCDRAGPVFFKVQRQVKPLCQSG